MCIIIDTNTLPSVFDKKSAQHKEFSNVLDWIRNGKGKIIFGGTRYKRELGKYLSLFVEYNKAKKAICAKDDAVDRETEKVSKMILHPDFDDQHLVALLRVTGCRLICSLDERAYPFFTHTLFFNTAKNKPKIYNGHTNKNILTERNIADICKPSYKTTNQQRALLTPEER